MTTGWAARRREPSLRRLISRQCDCSRRCVYLLDESFYFPTDAEIDACVSYLKTSAPNRAPVSDDDCDDPARDFWCDSKNYFKAKSVNVASAFLLRRRTSLQKAHAFNFFIRKSDHRLIFIDDYERVPISGRAYLVVM